MTADPVATVVLAAGASRRYGGIKLLADTGNGETLLRRTVRVALEAGLGPVVVVLGAHRRALGATLGGVPAEIVYNPSWQEGMGRSIAAGIAHVRVCHPDACGAVVVPADLPRLPVEHLRALPAAAVRTALPAAATAGAGGLLQAPAYFARELFTKLEALIGDRGARDILRRNPTLITSIPPPFPLEDLDTP